MRPWVCEAFLSVPSCCPAPHHLCPETNQRHAPSRQRSIHNQQHQRLHTPTIAGQLTAHHTALYFYFCQPLFVTWKGNSDMFYLSCLSWVNMGLLAWLMGGGIAQLVSHPPLMLETRGLNPGGGLTQVTPMHEWEGSDYQL